MEQSRTTIGSGMTRGDVFTINSTEAGDGSVLVEFSGDLDVASSPALYQEVARAVGGGAALITIDLAGTDLIDWAGIGAIAAALWRLRTAGGDLALARVPTAIREALEVSRIAEIVTLDALEPNTREGRWA